MPLTLRARGGDATEQVVLCSRHPLTSRQFDLPMEWINPRRTTRLRNNPQFHGRPAQEKLDWIQSVRGGGTIPEVGTPTFYRHQCIITDTISALMFTRKLNREAVSITYSEPQRTHALAH
eukprot:9502738-Pyramimonas_sp.AAC.3